MCGVIPVVGRFSGDSLGYGSAAPSSCSYYCMFLFCSLWPPVRIGARGLKAGRVVQSLEQVLVSKHGRACILEAHLLNTYCPCQAHALCPVLSPPLHACKPM